MTLRFALVGTAGLVLGCGWAGAQPAAKPRPPCREAALVSLRTGHVLRRFSAAWSDFARGYATGPLIPGGDAVGDGHGGWFVAGVGIRHMRSDGTLDGWRSQLGRKRVVGGLVRVGDVLFVHDGYRVFAVSATSGAVLWASQRAH